MFHVARTPSLFLSLSLSLSLARSLARSLSSLTHNLSSTHARSHYLFSSLVMYPTRRGVCETLSVVILSLALRRVSRDVSYAPPGLRSTVTAPLRISAAQLSLITVSYVVRGSVCSIPPSTHALRVSMSSDVPCQFQIFSPHRCVVPAGGDVGPEFVGVRSTGRVAGGIKEGNLRLEECFS
jgi:hypothetical protein